MADSEGKADIETGADTLLSFLEEKSKWPVSRIADDLGVPEDTVKKWAKALEKSGLVEIKYSAIKGMVLEYSSEKSYEELNEGRSQLPLETEELEIEAEKVEEVPVENRDTTETVDASEAEETKVDSSETEPSAEETGDEGSESSEDDENEHREKLQNNIDRKDDEEDVSDLSEEEGKEKLKDKLEELEEGEKGGKQKKSKVKTGKAKITKGESSDSEEEGGSSEKSGKDGKKSHQSKSKLKAGKAEIKKSSSSGKSKTQESSGDTGEDSRVENIEEKSEEVEKIENNTYEQHFEGQSPPPTPDEEGSHKDVEHIYHKVSSLSGDSVDHETGESLEEHLDKIRNLGDLLRNEGIDNDEVYSKMEQEMEALKDRLMEREIDEEVREEVAETMRKTGKDLENTEETGLLDRVKMFLSGIRRKLT
jgi:Mn-dependent DtxR family transcriptional regulator